MIFKRCKNILTWGGGRPLGKPSSGAILIEFAFAVPIMMMLLYYIHDLFLFKRMHSLTQFAALQMCNILQNVSQNRSDKKITLDDFKYALSAAYLCLYQGTSMFSEKQGEWIHPIGHYPHPIIYYVKGNSDGTASIIWKFGLYPSYSASPTTIVKGNGTPQENLNPKTIHPDLIINPGEVKIIIESFLFSDARANRSHKQVFGFYILDPKIKKTENVVFPSSVIFSPRPGLFSETPPQ